MDTTLNKSTQKSPLKTPSFKAGFQAITGFFKQDKTFNLIIGVPLIPYHVPGV